VNMAANQTEADEAGKKLVILSKRFLGLEIEYLGFVPRDPAMIKAVREQKPVFLSAPLCPAAVSMNRLADMLMTGKDQRSEGNLINFFKKVTQIFGSKQRG